MPNSKKDKTISALEAVHAALKPLKPEERQRVLASVHALLVVSSGRAAVEHVKNDSDAKSSLPTSAPSSTRPVAIQELILDKKPSSHPQFITLFAYYREKYQGQPRFAREDLRQYYASSRQEPPGNYDRDFVNTVKKGWIHEDGDNSYITSKGIEAVESGFEKGLEGKSRPGRRKASKKKKNQRGGK
jgi:hypothetical protein